MEEMEEFEENMLATCNFHDENRQEIIQLQTESIILATFMGMDQLYKDLKPLINSISEYDYAKPVTDREEKWPLFEIFDDGKGPLTIVFIFQNRLNTYNPDGSINENDEDSEFAYPMVVSKVFYIDETYYEHINNDMHFWMKEKYEMLKEKANLC